jgi:putative flippase GtrA
MVVSFAINKNAVFGDGKRYSPQQFVAFVIVTAVGLWGLQTIIVVGMNNILRLTIVKAAHSTGNSATIRWIIPNVAKGVATIISAIWNYFWYDRVIFAKKDVSLSEWM